MELLQTIALLCQVSINQRTWNEDSLSKQLDCQQRYIHCVNTKTEGTQAQKLERCILEKK